jgi:excisionase family DNA binding protein
MPELFTVKEVAELLRANPATIRRWVQEGRLRGYWAGQKMLFSQATLAEFLEPTTALKGQRTVEEQPTGTAS